MNLLSSFLPCTQAMQKEVKYGKDDKSRVNFMLTCIQRPMSLLSSPHSLGQLAPLLIKACSQEGSLHRLLKHQRCLQGRNGLHSRKLAAVRRARSWVKRGM